jgi:hypothetical protein
VSEVERAVHRRALILMIIAQRDCAAVRCALRIFNGSLPPPSLQAGGD